jgi:hypothetical protein
MKWLVLACVLAGCGDPGASFDAVCAEMKDENACKAHPDCHPVFVDPGNCTCLAIGCCTMFQHCAGGDKADCRGPALCRAATPRCEGSYTVAYASSCYEGCVLQSDCAP